MLQRKGHTHNSICSITTSAWVQAKGRTAIYHLPKITITTLSPLSTVYLFTLGGTEHGRCWVSFSLNNAAPGVLCYAVSMEHLAPFSTSSCMGLSDALCIQCCIPLREETLRGVQGKTYCNLNLLWGHKSLNSTCFSTRHRTRNHQNPVAAMPFVRYPYLTEDKLSRN